MTEILLATLNDVGSAGGKAASNPNLGTLASISGNITTNHIAQFADANGTIQDGGPIGAANGVASLDSTGKIPLSQLLTGNSGATLPLLNTANTWSGIQSFNSGVVLAGNTTLADGGTHSSSGTTLAAPTGGAKGAGTLNATGLYVNGVSVTGGGASTAATPANPTGTTSTSTYTMCGLGSSCTITPVATGRIAFSFNGTAQNNTANNGLSLGFRYGTGTAPANGAAITGISLPIQTSCISNNANQAVPFALSGIITGQALGVPVWLDMIQLALVGGTGSLDNLTFYAHEF